MSGATTSAVGRPRLNPFAFPSDTTLRFVLLLIFVVCGSARLWGDFRPTDPAMTECAVRAWLQMSGAEGAPPGGAGRDAAAPGSHPIAPISRCAALARPVIAWKLVGMCLVIAVAAILYFLYPAWKRRTGRLEPVSSSDVPGIEDELRGIVDAARLPDPPVFVWNPLAAGLPVAFGRRRRYQVALSGSFVARYFHGDRSAFRAVLLHELAHVRNGDVHKAYFTMSLWLAFIATALAPALVVFLWRLATARWFDALPLLLYSFLWTAVIVLSGLAVLRARECYADVQASVWDRSSGLDRVLATLSGHEGEGWRRLFRFHPEPGERRRIVEDPSRLLRPGFAEAFGIGIAAFAIVQVMLTLAMPFLPQEPAAAQAYYWSVVVLVPTIAFLIAIGAIGIGVWRTAFASVLNGEHPSRGTGWLGAAFVAGAFPLLVVSLAEAGLQSFAEPSIPFSVALNALLVNALTYIVLLLGCLLIFRWIATAASAWFDIVVQSRSPWPILFFSVATALILVLGTLAVGLFIVAFSIMVGPGRGSLAMAIYQYGLAAGVPVLVASLTAWAFPLAALWWRKAGTNPRIAPWVFLDGASARLPDRAPLRASGALLAGVVMGLMCCLLWVLVRHRGQFPSGIADGIAASFGWFAAWSERVFGSKGFLMPLLAMIFQALAAAIAAARALRLSTMCGLFAGSIAGFVIVVGNTLIFGIAPAGNAWNQVLAALQLVGLGAVVALPTALVAGWAGNVARRARAHGVAQPVPAGS